MKTKLIAKICLTKFHEISFLKEYGTLYSLLEDLVIRKTTVNSADTNQISFLINLMHEYNDCSFDKKTQIDLAKGRFITLS